MRNSWNYEGKASVHGFSRFLQRVFPCGLLSRLARHSQDFRCWKQQLYPFNQSEEHVMLNIRKLFFFMALLTGMYALQGCDANEGPLEEAGEEIDDAVDDIGDEIDDATD